MEVSQTIRVFWINVPLNPAVIVRYGVPYTGHSNGLS